MSEDQRVISQPIELHKLSIVDKHSQGQQQQPHQKQHEVQPESKSPRVTTPLKPKDLLYLYQVRKDLRQISHP